MSFRYFALPILLVVSTAAAATIAHQRGSETWTEVAGQLGPRQETVTARSEFHALRGIKLWEYDRRACAIDVEQSSLNTPSRAIAGMLRACEPRASQSWKAADVGDGRYLTAIEVCTAEGRDAPPGIRGVRIWGSTLDGVKVAPPSADVRVELFGCKKWHGKVACPEGKVATALRGRYADAQTGIVGLELGCHALSAKGDES